MDKWENIFKIKLQNIKKWHQGEFEISRTFLGNLIGPSLALESNKLTQKSEEFTVINKSDLPSKMSSIRVFFVSDDFQLSSKETEDLLEKMILAMKIEQSDYLTFRCPFSNEKIEDYEKNFINPSIATQNLFQKVIDYRPLVIASMGATATHILLGKKEKLSAIHGEFIEKEISISGKKHKFFLVPIFHPELLLINPNMKRTAWIDLQKITSFLNNNP